MFYPRHRVQIVVFIRRSMGKKLGVLPEKVTLVAPFPLSQRVRFNRLDSGLSVNVFRYCAEYMRFSKKPWHKMIPSSHPACSRSDAGES